MLDIRDLKPGDSFQFAGGVSIFRIVDSWVYKSVLTQNRFNIPTFPTSNQPVISEPWMATVNPSNRIDSMRTTSWKREKAGDGRYHVRLKAIGDEGDGYRIRGLIIGGNRKWSVEIGGRSFPRTYKTIREACDCLVRVHFNLN